MKQGQSIATIWQKAQLSQSSRYGRIFCWMIGLETTAYNESKSKSMENQTINHLNENIMSKEMDWDTFVPTREILEYDKKLRESIRQREQLKQELSELEKRKKDIFWDVEYAMFSAGLKYFNTCSEYWLYKVESEYIKAEKEYLAGQVDI